MTRTRPDEERVWLQAMIAAVGGLSSINVTQATGDSAGEARIGWDGINAELAKDAAEIADQAIKRWRERYPDETTTEEEESGL